MKIVELLIGKENFLQFITKIARDYRSDSLYIEDVELIVNAYSIAILLIGFTKKTVEIDEFKIKLDSNDDIPVNIKNFCENYKTYIQKIEESKFDLLRKII